MKKRIRLGISSMCTHPNKMPPLGRTAISSTESNAMSDSAFSDLSASDLDDMFSSNLRLLYLIDENKNLSDTSTKQQSHYHSSLNVYISPQNESNKIKNPPTLKRSCVYSSYETLYDNLISKRNGDEKERHRECMSQSIVESSRGTIDDYLKFGSNISCDSDGTLKSSSSRNSSHVSSLNSDEQNLEISASNLSLPMSNDIHMNTKLRPHPNKVMSRPMSYHMGDSMGYYYSNKPPSYPFNNHTDIKSSRKEGTYTPSNIITNRSITKPLLNSHNSSKTNIVLSSNIDGSRLTDHTDSLSINPRNIFNNDTNIINNQIIQLPLSSSRQTKNNISVIPPVAPPRNKMKKSITKIADKPQKETMDTVTESPTSVPVKSSVNLNVGPRANEIKSNGRKLNLHTPNYDNEFFYPDSRTNCISYCRTTEIHRNNQKN